MLAGISILKYKKKNPLMTELHTPLCIGNVMVLPGDLVIATAEGVLFVPTHMAEQVVDT